MSDTVRVDRLFRALRAPSPHRSALVSGETGLAVPYEELGGRVERTAAGLRRLGIQRGDRVALWAESSTEFVVALLAVYRSGGIAVPVNTRYREAEVGHVVDDSGAVAIVHDRPDGRGGIECASIRHRIALGRVQPGEHTLAQLEGIDDRLDDALPNDDDPALIIYTSGTTGTSKGALLTHRAVVDNMVSLTELWRWSGADRLVLALPLFHVHGLCIGLHGALLHGMTIISLPRFSPEGVVRAFRERGGNLFMGVPTMYAQLLEHLDAHPHDAEPLRGGKLFTAGSAALAPEQLERFEALTGHRILERYGMTETLITLSNPLAGERRAGSVGLPVPGCDIRVVDDHGEDVPAGVTGELLVRSNGIMDRYWGRPDTTRAAFRDGWFATGDVVTRESDGYVRIVGRKSVDIIKSGGFKIAAREIEDVLQRHPSVREVAVVGVPDPRWGERIAAAVVLASGDAPSVGIADTLSGYVAEHLADYKKPREILVLESLPRNALGKVEKVRLRAMFERDPPS